VPVTITNPPNIIEKVMPFVGRNHIKLALVDDIAWIGGLSYRDADLVREDFMMRVADPEVVPILEEVFYTTDYDGITEDKVFDLGDTKVICDGGRRGQSAIFDRGIADVRGASSSVRLISQYHPNGAMAGALAFQAEMGRDVLSITSSSESISEWFGRVLDRGSIAYSRLQGQSILTAHSKIRVHAKALLVDVDDPDRAEGMVGSHNLTRAGVFLGTQEVGLFSRKPEFIASLRDYFAKVVGRIALEQSVALNNEF
jgi:phosphatidylserine/phosphatidylglycerophosphate/cardiolipin synthase-like enzyme